MKIIFFTVLACLAMIAEPHPFLGLDIAAGLGQGLAKAVGTGVALGLGTAANIGAGVLGLGTSVVDGLANGVENGLNGLAQSASRNVQQGTQGESQNNAEEAGAYSEESHKKSQNNAEEAGAYSEESHKKSEKNHHNRAHHRTSVTTITRVINSDEHDVGSHEAVEESAHEAGAFNKHASAAKNDGSNYEGSSQEEEQN